MAFCAGFLTNSGNYKSFGDTKIVPELDEIKFSQFLLKNEWVNSMEKQSAKVIELHLYLMKCLYKFKKPYS